MESLFPDKVNKLYLIDPAETVTTIDSLTKCSISQYIISHQTRRDDSISESLIKKARESIMWNNWCEMIFTFCDEKKLLDFLDNVILRSLSKRKDIKNIITELQDRITKSGTLSTFTLNVGKFAAEEKSYTELLGDRYGIRESLSEKDNGFDQKDHLYMFCENYLVETRYLYFRLRDYALAMRPSKPKQFLPKINSIQTSGSYTILEQRKGYLTGGTIETDIYFLTFYSTINEKSNEQRHITEPIVRQRIDTSQEPNEYVVYFVENQTTISSVGKNLDRPVVLSMSMWRLYDKHPIYGQKCCILDVWCTLNLTSTIKKGYGAIAFYRELIKFTKQGYRLVVLEVLSLESPTTKGTGKDVKQIVEAVKKTHKIYADIGFEKIQDMIVSEIIVGTQTWSDQLNIKRSNVKNITAQYDVLALNLTPQFLNSKAYQAFIPR